MKDRIPSYVPLVIDKPECFREYEIKADVVYEECEASTDRGMKKSLSVESLEVVGLKRIDSGREIPLERLGSGVVKKLETYVLKEI